ncbi:MAG TPA: hypothetical protein VHD63_17155, partial [Ktedonobacteraceae bacterium]|nr:hypothetical protein [Ktedonobacteraceae bacterium]
ALPTLRTRRMHPQSSISAFPADSWQALETPEDEAGATETAPEDAANALAEVALETPAEQKAFAAPAQTAQTTPEPADVEDVDTISLSMTELAEIAATPLDAPAPTTPVAPVAPAAQAPAAEKAEDGAGEAVTAPVTQTPAQAEATSAVSREPLSPVPATPEPQAVDVADLPTSHIPTAAVPPTLKAESETAQPAHGKQAPLSPIPQTPRPDKIATAPTSGPLSRVPQTPRPDETATAPAGKPLSPIPQTPQPKEAPPVFTPQAVEEAAPRPQATPPASPSPVPPPATPARSRPRKNVILLAALIVALVILLGGTGTYLLLRPQASTNTAQCSSQQTTCVNGTPITIVKKPTSLTFSGKVAGPMTIVAVPTCQNATSGNLRTLTVNLSGTINDKLYNFGFVIEHYNGASTYSNATTSLQILFTTPGESTANGWSNSDPADTGSITVDKGEQTGSITYSLSGAGTSAKTQVQVSGTWSCGK